MVKRRRLGDLYVRGREVTFDDGAGEPVTVYVRKLTPVEHEKAMRAANAARTRVLTSKRRVDSDEYQDMWGEVESFTKVDLVNYLIFDERSHRTPALEAELGAEEEWAKDDYLQGLTDAWEGGLEARYALDAEDEEAVACLQELERFAKQVDVALTGETDRTKADLEGLTEDALRLKVFDQVVSVHASLEWITEYRRMEVYLGTRETDQKSKYFADRSEVDGLPLEVFAELQRTYQNLSVDPTEGKDSEETPDSSPSSDQPEAGETGLSSGQRDAAA